MILVKNTLNEEEELSEKMYKKTQFNIKNFFLKYSFQCKTIQWNKLFGAQSVSLLRGSTVLHSISILNALDKLKIKLKRFFQDSMDFSFFGEV